MKTKSITLSLMIATMGILSYSANAQQDKVKPYSNPADKQEKMDKQNNSNQNPDLNRNQNPNRGTQQDTIGNRNQGIENQMNEDHIMMQNGKMIMIKNGKTIPLDKDMTLKNGTITMSNGKYKMKDGTILTFNEGDIIDMNGKVSTYKDRNINRNNKGEYDQIRRNNKNQK